MYPDLFGISNGSYTLCMIVGIALAIVFEVLYLKKSKITFDGVIDLLICACFAVASGIVFAILFENLYEFIEKGANYTWTWGMTFFGGLAGGAAGFLLTYFFMRKNCHFDLGVVVQSAPVGISIAHAIGRIGCFLAGCCYGRKTDSWIGVDFPHIGKRIPTQLIESIFLFILFAIMITLLLVKKFKYDMVVYMASYSVFRFIIEFYRDDPRGVALALSPSQIWSIILFVGAIPVYLWLRKKYKTPNEQK